MNIYIMLFDAAPYCSPFKNLNEVEGFNVFGQIAHCFTGTSIISLLTGKMPSDLIDGGMGYETEYRFYKDGVINWPWEDQIIFSILREAGWKVEIHTDNPFFGDVISQNYDIKYGDIHEKDYINSVQEDKGVNRICFILYNTYHDGIGGKISIEHAEEKISTCLNYWDFKQKNSFFWLFADHGDFTKITEHIEPVGYMSWAMMKDNTDNPIVPKTSLISIRDFYPTIMEKLNLPISDPIINNECRSVTKDLDLKRIYYVEDGRSHVDLQCSTVAAAIKFDEWSGIEEEYKYSQVTLYKKRPDTISRKGYPYNTNILEISLRNRFKWI